MKKISPLFFDDKTVLSIMGIIIFCIGILFVHRYVNKISTDVSIVRPMKGIICATMITVDGAAISCWKENKPKKADKPKIGINYYVIIKQRCSSSRPKPSHIRF